MLLFNSSRSVFKLSQLHWHLNWECFHSFNLHGALKTNLTHFNRETRESRTFDNSLAMTRVALRHQQELETWERLMSLNAQSVADVNAFAVYLNVSQLNFPMTWRGIRMPSITDRFDLWHPTMTKHQTLHTGPVHYMTRCFSKQSNFLPHTRSRTHWQSLLVSLSRFGFLKSDSSSCGWD